MIESWKSIARNENKSWRSKGRLSHSLSCSSPVQGYTFRDLKCDHISWGILVTCHAIPPSGGLHTRLCRGGMLTCVAGARKVIQPKLERTSPLHYKLALFSYSSACCAGYRMLIPCKDSPWVNLWLEDARSSTLVFTFRVIALEKFRYSESFTR